MDFKFQKRSKKKVENLSILKNSEILDGEINIRKNFWGKERLKELIGTSEIQKSPSKNLKNRKFKKIEFINDQQDFGEKEVFIFLFFY